MRAPGREVEPKKTLQQERSPWGARDSGQPEGLEGRSGALKGHVEPDCVKKRIPGWEVLSAGGEWALAHLLSCCKKLIGGLGPGRGRGKTLAGLVQEN